MKSLRRSFNNNHHGHGHNPSHSQSNGHSGANGQPATIQHITTTGPMSPPGGPGSAGPASASVINPLARPSERIAPPQKVIRALNSHRSTNPQELSYAKGDFWYVTGEREGWYEAFNPMTKSRGLVPKKHFEAFTRAGRQASASGSIGSSSEPATSPVAPSHNPDHQRSASHGLPTTVAMSPTTPLGPGSQSQPQTPHHRRPTQPLYAIVQYDFRAERPDELEAKAGEPIVVIAQSNHEWFVAKPIGRLGGPGLIPVSFVEIRDPMSGRPLEAFPSHIPQVEEWKKATAEYKAAAIPLGRLDLGPDHQVPNSPYAAAAQANALASKESQATQKTARSGSPESNSRTAPGSSHQRQTSASGSQHTGPKGYEAEHDAMLPPGELVRLGVPSFHNESGNYWFRLHAKFIPDDPNAPAYTLILYRTYEDFYEFQITLLDTFPAEAGRHASGEERAQTPPRILPYMPGPVDDAIDNELTEYRRSELDAYVLALLDLGRQGAGYIMRHELIRTFFAAKYGDYCEEEPRPGAVEELSERMGAVDVAANSHNPRSQSQSSHQTQPSGGSITAPNGRGPAGPREPRTSWTNPQHARSESRDQPGTANSLGAPHHGQWTTSPAQSSFNGSQQQSPLPLASAGATHSPVHPAPIQTPRTAPAPLATGAPQPPRAAPGGYVKIKIYDRATDDLIALRVHPQVTYAELLDKVRARLGPEVSVLQYRVGGGGTAAAGLSAPCRMINDDRELAEWMATEDKLVLYAEQ